MATFAYDDLPYPSFAHARTDPSRLAAAALLAGYQPPPPETAHILDLGCGDGFNVLALASSLPNAFVKGFDLSPVQVAKGEKLRLEAGLDNALIEVGDIFTMPLTGETYDYIIMHGVYSWVPENVAQRMLTLVAARLKPGGLIYVSYDSDPVGPMKTALHHLIRNATENIDDPRAKFEAGRHIIASLARNQPSDSAYREYLDQCVALYVSSVDEFAAHDILSSFHRSISPKKLETEMEAAGLTLLCDASVKGLLIEKVDANAKELLDRFGDTPAKRADLIAHLLGRIIRTSIFVRCDTPPPKRVNVDAFSSLWFSCDAKKELISGDDNAKPKYQYTTKSKVSFPTDNGLVIFLLDTLRDAWPNELRIEDFPTNEHLTSEVISEALSFLVACEVVVPFGSQGQAAIGIPERPRVSGLVRTLAARGTTRLPSLRITTTILEDEMTLYFVSLLDGTRTAADLMAMIFKKLGRTDAVTDDTPARSAIEALATDCLFLR